jgi:hypothetical protein
MVSGTGILTLGTVSTGSTSSALIPYTYSSPPLRREHVSGARWFFGDVMIAFVVLNEARHRAVAAVFGVSKDWRSNLITLIVIGAVASALRRVAAAPRTQVRKMRSSSTAVGDTMIVAAVLRATLRSLAGPRPRATSRAAALIAFAVVANSIRPTARRILGAIQGAVRGALTDLRKARDAVSRYGVDGTGVTAVADPPRSPSGAGSGR